VTDKQEKKTKYEFPHVHALEHPIELKSGDTTDALVFQPLTLRGVRNLRMPFSKVSDQLSWDHVLSLAESMTGLAQAKLDRMRGADCGEVFKIVMAAWGEFQPTGSDE